MKASTTHAEGSVTRTSVLIIGSGFSGLGMAVSLKREGRHDFIVLERATDVGGTWRDNTYPGRACDIQSHLYSYSFKPNPRWSRVYAPQPEILDLSAPHRAGRKYSAECAVRRRGGARLLG